MEKEGKACYRYGKDGQEMERLGCLEFIALVTSHILGKGQVTIRHYGLCSEYKDMLKRMIDWYDKHLKFEKKPAST